MGLVAEAILHLDPHLLSGLDGDFAVLHIAGPDLGPLGVEGDGDVDASLTLTKILTLTLRTNLIYDENIQIADAAGDLAPRVQFKEIVSLGLTWTFGQYVKPE